MIRRSEPPGREPVVEISCARCGTRFFWRFQLEELVPLFCFDCRSGDESIPQPPRPDGGEPFAGRTWKGKPRGSHPDRH